MSSLTTWPELVLRGAAEGNNSTDGLASLVDHESFTSRPRRKIRSKAALTAAFLLIISAVVSMILVCQATIRSDPLFYKAPRRLAGVEESEGSEEEESDEMESCLDHRDYTLLPVRPDSHLGGSEASTYEAGEHVVYFSETSSLSDAEDRSPEGEASESNILESISSYQQLLGAFNVDESVLVTETDAFAAYPSFSPPPEASPRPETTTPEEESPRLEPTTPEEESPTPEPTTPEEESLFLVSQGSQSSSFAQLDAGPSKEWPLVYISRVGIKRKRGGPQSSVASSSANSGESEVKGGRHRRKRRRPALWEAQSRVRRRMAGFMAFESSIPAGGASPTTSSQASAASLASFSSATPSTSHAHSPDTEELPVAGVSEALPSVRRRSPPDGASAVFSPNSPPKLPPKGRLLCQLPILQEGAETVTFDPEEVFSQPLEGPEFRIASLKRLFVLFQRPEVNQSEGSELVEYGKQMAALLSREHTSPVNSEDSIAIVRVLAFRYLVLDALFCVTQILPDAMKPDRWWAEHMSRISSEFRKVKLIRTITASKVALAQRLGRALESLKRRQRPSDEETAYLKTVLLIRRHEKLYPSLQGVDWEKAIGDDVIQDLLMYARDSENFEQIKELKLKSQAAFALPCSASPMSRKTPVLYRLPARVEKGVRAKFQKDNRPVSARVNSLRAGDFLSFHHMMAVEELKVENAEKLMKYCQQAVWHLEHLQRYPVDALHFESVARSLGYRYLILDTVFCTIQILPGPMDATNWWLDVLRLTPTKYSGEAAVSEEDKKLEQLVKRLGDAMELLKQGVRPSLEETLSLKEALLLDFNSPLGLSPARVRIFRAFVSRHQARERSVEPY